ncbi:uncharacterized protein LOC134184992 isoform X2 [Corticium candelabrum]|nr:uncharacterized protein LOC134184992 isoform X2 [Corticium candelabrum]
MASPTYQTDPDMDVTCSLLEKKEPEAMSRDKGVVSSLSFQAANVIGARLPFEAVELWAQRLGKKMADEVQLAVMKASFPVDKGLVRRYAYLSRKTSGYGKFSDLFQQPTRTRMQTDNLEFAVEDVMQIGFCLTGKIQNRTYMYREDRKTIATVYFDRQHVTSMLCSDHSDSNWCEHVVALIFHRMNNPEKVKYRLPVSDSVQLLSESEQKQFINILLAHRPLELLAFAQETLDELLNMKDSNRVSSQCESLHNALVVNVPDPTAGGAVDAEGLWNVDDKDIRQISQQFFHNDSALCVSPLVERYRERSESWDTILKRSTDKSESSISSIFDNGSFEESKMQSHYFSKEVDTMLHVITDLIKKGEKSSIAALNIITEEWLEALAKKAIGKEEMRKFSSQSSNWECNILEVIPQMIPQEVYSQMPQRARNVQFLSAIGPFFVPDKLAVSWRRAAFGLIFDDDLVLSIRHKLKDLAQKFANIVTLAFTNMEKEKQSESRRTAYYSTQAAEAFWSNLSEWNRFQHIADLLNPTVCEAFRTLSKDVISVSKSPVLPSISTGFEVLYTGAYLVLCLMDSVIDKETAEIVARSCIMETFNPILLPTHHENGCDFNKELAWESGHELFSTVVQCHDKIAESFWGCSWETGLIYVVNVLFNAIETSSWAWSVRYTWNVAPWINGSLATGLMGKGTDSTVNIVNVVAPSAMFLGLLHVILPIDIKNTSSIEQAAIAREKNRILSIMFQRMSEMNDDVPQQISLLVPFLEQNLVHLDAPSTALMLLHSTILLNPELDVSSNEQRGLLSAIIAALRQQTIVLASLLTGTSSVDFSCYETRCAASALMALETYSQSKEDLSHVFRCITDPILQLLQEGNATEAIGDKETTEGKSKKHSQKNAKIVLNKGLLSFYVTDGIGIVSVLCGNDFRHYGYSESRIDERLSLLKSPIAELMENSDFRSKQQKPKSVLPPVVIRTLNKKEPGESTLKWQTALDLLLFLLRVDLFCGEERTRAHSSLTLLQTVAERVGAISFLEKLSVAKDWSNVITAEELFTFFLSQNEFQSSFLAQKEGCASAIASLKEIFTSCSTLLSARHSSELYKTACDLEIVDDVVVEVLADDHDLQQNLSHEFLFLLAQHDTEKATLTQRLQVGIAALNRWQQHLSTSGSSLSLCNVYPEHYRYSNSDDTAIFGCLRLAALAVRVDEEASRPHHTRLQATVCNKMEATTLLLSVLSQDWIDPVIAAIVLVEVCRTLQNRIEETVSEDSSPFANTSILSNLQQVFWAHNKFMTSSNAETMFCKLSTASHVAKEIAQKSKTSIAKFLVYYKDLATKPADSTKKSKSNTLDRVPYVCDLVCLQFLCQVIPDDGFDFEALINLENESQSQSYQHHHGYTYREVVKAFKRRKNSETADRTTATNAASFSDEVNVNFWQLVAFQKAMQMQMHQEQRLFGFYGFDDSD